jgi:hypothetical protein
MVLRHTTQKRIQLMKKFLAAALAFLVASPAMAGNRPEPGL